MVANLLGGNGCSRPSALLRVIVNEKAVASDGVRITFLNGDLVEDV